MAGKLQISPAPSSALHPDTSPCSRQEKRGAKQAAGGQGGVEEEDRVPEENTGGWRRTWRGAGEGRQGAELAAREGAQGAEGEQKKMAC